MSYWNQEERFNKLFEKLVPNEGQCETKEGEMLRACGKICYRWYNDGDYYYEGYGTETAGPAHSYLVTECPICVTLTEAFKIVDFKREDDYKNALEEVVNIVLDYVEPRIEANTLEPNDCDMYECDPIFEDDTEEECDDGVEEFWASRRDECDEEEEEG